MTIRITFNGKEYPSPEAMPEEARQAYQQALAQLTDAQQNSIPDILGGAARRNVIGIQNSSITVNGRTYDDVGDMPAAVRCLYEQAMASVDQDRNSHPDALTAAGSGGENLPPSEDQAALGRPYGRDRMMTVLGQFDSTLVTFFRLLLGIVAVAIVAGAVFIMRTMDAASSRAGGRWYVAGAALVALFAVESQFAWLMRRREGLIDTEREPWSYSIRSGLLLLTSAVVLFGLAWYWG